MNSVFRLFALCLCVAVASSVGAQEPELWPGAKYDPAIPTIKQVLGHEHGAVITPPDGIAQYLQALQKAAPTRARLIEYARTWEGRPLWLFVIGSPDRIAKIEQVKTDLRRLADPRGVSAADQERLVKELPVVVWLVHGVHGNEISSADAALAEAYHLLAAQGDEDVNTVLRDALVLIDPMQNPDGRARFVFQNLLGQASKPDDAPYSAEHDEPWPGGRVNHYLFDMNRDWFAQSGKDDICGGLERASVGESTHYMCVCWPASRLGIRAWRKTSPKWLVMPTSPTNSIPSSRFAMESTKARRASRPSATENEW